MSLVFLRFASRSLAHVSLVFLVRGLAGILESGIPERLKILDATTFSVKLDAFTNQHFLYVSLQILCIFIA